MFGSLKAHWPSCLHAGRLVRRSSFLLLLQLPCGVHSDGVLALDQPRNPEHACADCDRCPHALLYAMAYCRTAYRHCSRSVSGSGEGGAPLHIAYSTSTDSSTGYSLGPVPRTEAHEQMSPLLPSSQICCRYLQILADSAVTVLEFHSDLR